MLDLNEKIICLLKSNCKYKFKDICTKLSDYNSDLIYNTLTSMCDNGIIYFKNNLFSLMPSDFSLETVRVDNDSIYIIKDDKKIILNNYNGVMDKDKCIINNNTLNIVDIYKRENDLIICEINTLGKISFNCIGSNVNYDIYVKDNDIKKVVDGSIVILKINNSDKNHLYCDLVEVIGHVNDPDVYLKSIAIACNFNVNFSKDALAQLEDIKTNVSADECIDKIDLTDEFIYTIDNDDTKDRDDAISIKINEKGNYVATINISDVSHYVPFNTPLFNEAYNNATSVYQLDSVIPMLPHELSNGICSLNEGELRLTLTVMVEMDKYGNIINSDVFKSFIKSKKQMKYSDVNKILMNKEKVLGYEDFYENLSIANEFSFLLNNLYKNNGYLNFSSKEIKYSNDSFDLNKSLAAQKIIENFMLLANKIVAEKFAYYNIPFRVHDEPDKKELEKHIQELKNMGYNIPNTKSYDLQSFLKELYDNGDYYVTSKYILKSMKRARYSNINIGHFGLGFNYYTHFTSPIRRFNDLLVHTIISNYLDNDISIINQIDNMEEVCDHISKQEQNADKAEELALYYKMAEVMENHIGEYFNGKIIHISKSAFKVQLTNNIIGTCKIKDIKGSHFRFDPITQTIKNGKIEYRIGDYVRVKSIYSSRKDLNINFEALENITSSKQKKLVS